MAGPTLSLGKVRNSLAARPPWALPQLNARLGTLLRSGYSLLAACVLLLTCGSLLFSGRDALVNAPADIRFGFRTVTIGAAARVEGVSDAAYRAGLRPGDTIVAVNRQPLSPDASEFEVGRHMAAVEDAKVELRVRPPHGPLHDLVLSERPNVWASTDPASGMPLWLSAVAQILDTRLLLIVVSLMLAAKRSRDPEALLLSFSLLLQGLPDLWWISVHPLISAAQHGITGSGQYLMFIAMAGFPAGRFASRWAKAALVGGLLAIAIETCARAAVLSGVMRRSTFAIITWPLLTLLVLLAAIALVRTYYTTAPGIPRQQIKWTVAGFCVSAFALGLSVALLSTGLIPNDAGIVAASPIIYLFQWLTVGGFSFGLLLSLLRYRLYDVDSAISRSISLGAVTLSLVAIFAGSEKVIEVLGEEYFGERLGALAGGLGAAIAAVMIVPIHHRVTHWAEHRFRSGLAHLRDRLPTLVGDMREMATPVTIASAALARIESGVRASYGAVIVDDMVVEAHGIDPDTVVEWLARGLALGDGVREPRWDRADPLFPACIPLRADGVGLIGWLLLGPRPDGSFYGREEREALQEIAEPVARALSISIERERRERVRQERDDGLARQVEALREFMRIRFGFDADAAYPTEQK